MSEDDDHLREALVFHGVEVGHFLLEIYRQSTQVGPIVGSTREFYKKLLARYVNGEVKQSEKETDGVRVSSSTAQQKNFLKVFFSGGAQY